jgi:hypothetical protein
MSQKNKEKKDDDSKSTVAIWLVCFIVGYILYAALVG